MLFFLAQLSIILDLADAHGIRKLMKRWSSLDELCEALQSIALPFVPPVTVASRNSEGDTPLHIAAIWGYLEAIELLIRAGANVNSVGDMGYTPLLHAVAYGHLAAIRVLLSGGASPHVRSEFGTTAVEAAMRSGNTELIALFFDGPNNSGNKRQRKEL
jgi:ankyrin repeat protein